MKRAGILLIVLIILVGIFIVINFQIDKNNIEKYGDYYSENEFLRTIDCAKLFDSNPAGTRYKVSFDLKTKTPGSMTIYQQNGTTCRYSWSPYPTIETTTEYSHYEVEIEPVLVHEEVTEAYLSFYGTYESGVIPVIKNLVVEPIKNN